MGLGGSATCREIDGPATVTFPDPAPLVADPIARADVANTEATTATAMSARIVAASGLCQHRAPQAASLQHIGQSLDLCR